jgi:acetoin utilization deacetylase AcuC-like enzyme
MHITYNHHHSAHDLIGRIVRRLGETHLMFWEQPKAPTAREAGDDQETPLRVDSIISALRAAGQTQFDAPDDFGRAPLEAVHDADFLRFLEHVYAEYAERTGVQAPFYSECFAVRRQPRKPETLIAQRGYYGFDVYTPILEGTWQAAYWSAQTALTTAERVRQGERMAYALCRPSGHHAGRDYYGGYCYLNNCAIATAHLQRASGRRVAILDFDYHHGNGTQDIFYDREDVLFVSLHARPDQAFPYYWGWEDERGVDAGLGYTYNLTLPKGTGNPDYLNTLDRALARIARYDPAYLVVSAGFDIGPGDPYGGFMVDDDGMRGIGLRIAALDLPTVIVQEGGYVAHKLGRYVTAFFEGFGAL